MNICGACGKDFSGVQIFDFHRVGKHDIDNGPDRRRCLTEDEMLAKGWQLNSKNVWFDPVSVERARSAFAR